MLIVEPPPPGYRSDSRMMRADVPSAFTTNVAVSVAVVTPGPLMVPPMSTAPAVEMLFELPSPLIPAEVLKTYPEGMPPGTGEPSRAMMTQLLGVPALYNFEFAVVIPAPPIWPRKTTRPVASIVGLLY